MDSRSPRTTHCPASLPLTKRERTASERALARDMLKRLRNGGEVRSRKVRRLRAAIKVGVYENLLKWHVALDRMKSDLT